MKNLVVGEVPKGRSSQEYEEETMSWWDENHIYEKVKTLIKDGSKFYFLDGPPYVTNPPHVGTAWNKILKDLVIRFKRMRGYNVRDQPGYDCHGLPIEVMVEERLGVKTKKEIEERIKIENFIEKCKEYAKDNLEKQTTTFKNLAIWMDWNNPYVTFENEYIESVWWTIKRAEEKGLLQKGLKVVHWCPRCETALAGYEVTDEYRLVKDHSIYVKFPISGREREYILIWTTTPWTLPANVAIMVNPEATYVRVKADDETYILAEARSRFVFEQTGKSYTVLQKFNGKELEGLKYDPPLRDEVLIQSQLKDAHKVVLSREYVSMEEGTGCVHSAPGHGEEDFEVGLEYNLPVVCPVDSKGSFTSEAGEYAGAYVADANKAILDDLKKKGLLLAETLIEHSYPHCWRCKTPLILRATDQWFLKVTELKEKLLETNDEIVWVPDWAGKKRFRDWLLGVRDWVISRQRYWGAPLPVWICESCGERIVVGSIEELTQRAINLPSSLDLHRQCVDAIKLRCNCGKEMKRVPDIVDVWIDSGIASWASLGFPKNKNWFEKWWPADFIVEAHDQTRGWFYSQLGTGLVAFGESPYKCVLMHGHTLDAQGERMSKSRGNFVSPEDVVARYGRDALRLYVTQCTVWDDFRFSWDTVEDTWRALQVIWNAFGFASLYMNLDGFAPGKWPLQKVWKHMRPEDKWLVSKTESLRLLVTREMDGLNVHLPARALVQYAVEDLSRWYIKLVRRRFWLEKESMDKMAAYSVLYHALKNWLVLSAPFIPLMAEKLYQVMIRPAERNAPQSVHMIPYPLPNMELVNPMLEEEMEVVKEVVGATASARQTLKIKLRQPVYRAFVVTDNPVVKKAIEDLERIVFEQANAKKFEFISIDEEERLKEITAKPKYEAIGPVFKAETKKVVEAIQSSDGREISESFRKNGFYKFSLDGKDVRITPEMVSFKEEMPEDFAVGTFSQGRVYVDASIPSALMQEGLVRDVVRRLQEMRREMNLPVDAYVAAVVVAPSEKYRKWLERSKDYIKEEARAKRLFLSKKGQKTVKMDLQKVWIINKDRYEMGLRLIERKS